MMRSLLFYFGTRQGSVVPWHMDHLDLDKTVSEVLDDLTLVNKVAADKVEMPIGDAASEYDLFDWENAPIPLETRIRKVARPGIILAIQHGIPDPKARAYSLRFFAVNQKEPYQRQILDSFLNGERGAFTPREYDIFISYSEKDEDIAREIKDIFGKRKVSCFMSQKAIKTGMIWEERIRLTLEGVSASVIIITPNSVKSKWVMCEAGALWALRKPLFPALMFVSPAELPELISKHQGIDIGTTVNRERLCDDVIQFCNLD